MVTPALWPRPNCMVTCTVAGHAPSVWLRPLWSHSNSTVTPTMWPHPHSMVMPTMWPRPNSVLRHHRGHAPTVWLRPLWSHSYSTVTPTMWPRPISMVTSTVVALQQYGYDHNVATPHQYGCSSVWTRPQYDDVSNTVTSHDLVTPHRHSHATITIMMT